jgi:hypothetical protein
MERKKSAEPVVEKSVKAAVLTLVAAVGMGQGTAPTGGAPAAIPADWPKSKAEMTNYEQTSTHAEVVAFFEQLGKRSPLLRMGSFGKTVEGRDLPWVTLADPPVADAAAARASGKPVVFVMANIHAGEVEGKEAMQHFARRVLLGDLKPLLEKLVIVIAPDYNADGNEKMSPMNRTAQNGPINGVGVRENKQGQDLNRDFIKMDAPETRALVGLMQEWDPLVTVDLHSTNGSYTHYHVTYSIPLNPMLDSAMLSYHRDTLMPALTRAMKARNWDTYYYGNFSQGQNPRSSGIGRGAPASGLPGGRGTAGSSTSASATQAALAQATQPGGEGRGRGANTGSAPPTGWYAFTHQPRIGQNYVGFRNRFAILSEAYTYMDFKRRVEATDDFVTEICQYVAAHGNEMSKLAREADERETKRFSAAAPVQLGVEYAPKALPGMTEILVGEVKRVPNPKSGRDMTAMVEEKVTPVKMLDYSLFEATRFVPAARAYVFKNEPGTKVVLEKLRLHGIKVEALNAPAEVAVETFAVGNVARAANPFQGHREVQVKGAYKRETVMLEPGALVVKTAQPLGLLAAYLLEPESDDGFTRWGFLDDYVAEGKVHPVMKVMGEFKAETREME